MICIYLNLNKRVANECSFPTCFSSLKCHLRTIHNNTNFFFNCLLQDNRCCTELNWNWCHSKCDFFVKTSVSTTTLDYIYKPAKKEATWKKPSFFKFWVVARSSLIICNVYNAVFHNVIHCQERNPLIWSLL